MATSIAYYQPQAIVNATTITAAQNTLISLCSTIFANRDFKNVDVQIADASKIRFGLMALAMSETSVATAQQIVVGLNRLCNIYNQQVVPTVS